MNCKAIIIFLVFGLVWAIGCSPDLKGRCDNNEECVEGYLCDKDNQCVEVEQEDLEILVTSLDDTILGKEYTYTLSARGGLKPYDWKVDSVLEWLEAEENTQDGTWKLTGVPTEKVSGVAVELTVTDSTIGDGQVAGKFLTLSVMYCDKEHEDACSGHGNCSEEAECSCDAGYDGNQCEKCAEGFQRNEYQECVQYEYKCEPEGECGADAYQRECVGYPCEEEWVLVEDCSDAAVCWHNDQQAGCTECGEFGCTGGKCNGCTYGSCCDNGQIRPEGYECYRWSEHRCSGSACGDNVEEQVYVKKCTGKSANCDGNMEVEKPWTKKDDCDSYQLCVSEGGAYPKCLTCEHGCSGEKCWDCNPASNSCCTPQGNFNDHCWHDEGTNLIWQNPPSNTEYTWSEAINYCNNLALGNSSNWRLPTISELRSLIRGCPATQLDGSCKVTDDCLDNNCWFDVCKGCSHAEGPGQYGCYWDPGCKGICARYWSSSKLEGSSSNAWYVRFSNGIVYDTPQTYSHGVRCIRSEP